MCVCVCACVLIGSRCLHCPCAFGYLWAACSTGATAHPASTLQNIRCKVSYRVISALQVTEKEGDRGVWVVKVSGVPAMELQQRSPLLTDSAAKDEAVTICTNAQQSASSEPYNGSAVGGNSVQD